MEIVHYKDRVTMSRPKKEDYPHEEFFVTQKNDVIVEVNGRVTKVSTYDKIAVAGIDYPDSLTADDFSIMSLDRAGVKPERVPLYFRATPEQMEKILQDSCVTLDELKEKATAVSVDVIPTKSEPELPLKTE